MANAPVAALTFIGVLLAVLGLFVGGNILIVITGIVALVAAGFIGVLADHRRSS